ncbi:flavin reductase [Brucella tritici]|uniref:FMN reductase n=1 Tax=Brucella tritici TaxID=94626 RepID=A0A6L3YMW1_9HYPH|nr:flavin reductase [Brucella tritici]KAB2684375.1 FMN reductase [Brucella tritici]
MDISDPSLDSVDRTAFRNGMSRLGSAVSVVTTLSGGHRHGFTASAVCSVSDTPATLLVCINRASSTFPAFATASHFCVNTLMSGQEEIADIFGGKRPVVDRFSVGQWKEGHAGIPVLADASVSFQCELADAVDQATHRVLFGRVIDMRENMEKATLLYCMRRYLYG